MAGRTATPQDDEGSILLLVLGYALLALALILVCVSATDLYIAQKRLDALADTAALAAAGDYELIVTEGKPRAELADDDVRARAAEMVAADQQGATLVSADTPDGVSARVVVSDTWHPPLVSLFVPDGVNLVSTSTSRTAIG